MKTTKVKNIRRLFILVLVLSCIGLIFSLLIKTPNKTEASFIQNGQWKTNSQREKGNWVSRGVGDIEIIDKGEYTEITNLNAWETGATYDRPVELNGLTVSFYSDGINTSEVDMEIFGYQDIFGFTLGSGMTENYPTKSETSFCVSFWNRLWGQTRLVIGENTWPEKREGTSPIAYVDEKCTNKMLYGNTVPEYVFDCTVKVGVSMTFEYVSASKVWKITTSCLYGTPWKDNHMTSYVKDEYIKAESGTEGNKKVYVGAFGYLGEHSTTSEMHEYIKVEECRDITAKYNDISGFTKISGLSAWGESVCYDDKLCLDGLKIGFYTEGIGKNVKFGNAIGFGFVKETVDYAPSSNGLCITYFPSGNNISLAISYNHKYADTICYKEETLKTKYMCNGTTTYAVLPYAEKFGLNFEFKQLGIIGENDVWSITITPLYGETGNLGKTTTLYINGSYLENIMDTNYNSYLSTYGWIGDQKDIQFANGSIKIESGFLRIRNMGSGTRELLTEDPINLDGTSIFMYTNNFDISKSGQAIGFGLSKTADGYPPSIGTTFCATLWCGIYGADQNRLFFGKSHDYNRSSIAFADNEMKNSSLGHTNQYVFDKMEATGIKLSFHDMSALNGTWRIDIETIRGIAFLGQCTSIFVSQTFFNNAMVDGKCYVVAYAMSPDNESLVDGYYKIEKGYTITYEIGDLTTATNVCANYRCTLPKIDSIENSIGIGWYSQETNKLYAQDSTIIIKQDMTLTAKYLQIYQSNGASIRKRSTSEDSGIRFNFNMDEDSFNEVSDFVKAVGLTVMPEDLIGYDKEFTFDNYSNDVSNIELKKADIVFRNGNLSFNGSIIDIKPENLSREFSARAYVLVNCNDVDTYVYVDYDKENNSRNIVDVAEMALKSGEDDEFKTMETYIDRVLNLEYTNNVFAIADKLGRTETAISKSITSSNQNNEIILNVTVNKELFNEFCNGKFSSVCINGERFKINSQSIAGNVVTLKIPKENEVKWNRVSKNSDMIKSRPTVNNGKINEMFVSPLNFGGGLRSTRFIASPTGKETAEQLGTEIDMNYGGKVQSRNVWTLAQWGCRHNIGNGVYTRNGSIIRYDDGAKSVEIDTAKVGCFTLEIKGSEEYTRDSQGRIRERTDGTENWPHILLQSNIGKVIDASLYKHLNFEINYEISKCESKVDRSIYPVNVGKNAAQFQWFVTIYDYNSKTKRTGAAFWFGISMFDTRELGGTPLATYQIDGGKTDSTGAFIYMPSLTEIDKNENCQVIGMPTSQVGKNIYVKYDLLPFINAAIEKVKSQGTTWTGDQIYIGSTNIGWELPGNYDVETKVNYMNFYAEYK